MITVIVPTLTTLHPRLEIFGHALFADKGADIVCAGISAIVFGFLHHLNKNYKNVIQIKIDSKQEIIVVFWENRHNKKIIPTLNIFTDEIEFMQLKYPQYVKCCHGMKGNN